MYLARHIGIATFIVCCIFSAQVAADEIRMKNGDVLTGDVVKKEGPKLIFKTSYAGEISLDWDAVESLDSDKTLDLVLANKKKYKAGLAAMGDGIAVMDPKEATRIAEIKLSEVKYINPSPELVRGGYRWTGRMNLGGTWTQGNSDTRALRFDAESIVRTLQNRYTVGAVFNRAQDRGNDTQFNSRGYGKYDHFLEGSEWYMYANAAFEQDRFRDIRLRSNIGGGAGRQVVESPDKNLSLEGGLNYINEVHYTAEDESYPSLRWAVKYDQMLLHGMTQFFHEHEAFVSITNADDMLVFSKTGFRFPLTSRLNASTQLNLNWDKSPAPGRKEADSTLMFTVGYGW